MADTFSSTIKYGVILRDLPPYSHPWWFATLEEAQAKYDACLEHLKPEYAGQVELVELVSVA